MKDPTPQDVADALDRLADLVADGALPIPRHIDIQAGQAETKRSAIRVVYFLTAGTEWSAGIQSVCDVTLTARNPRDHGDLLVLHGRSGPVHIEMDIAAETLPRHIDVGLLPEAQFDPTPKTCAGCGASHAWTIVYVDRTVRCVDCALDVVAADRETDAGTEAVPA